MRRVYAAELLASDAWHAHTALLAFPGGADKPYMARLNGRGNASILRYLDGGGALLGVCAGAYYTSARIVFEAGTTGEIRGSRELALFAGTARGSLHELAAPYALEHLHCAAATRVVLPNSAEPLHALYWGGPEFIPDPGASYRPLLEYSLPDGRKSLAAVSVERGRGRAVLIGVHAEVSGAQFPVEVSRFPADSYEHGMHVSAQLSQHDAERRRVFDHVIAALL